MAVASGRVGAVGAAGAAGPTPADGGRGQRSPAATAGHWWEHADLPVLGDRGGSFCRLAVDPDRAGGKDGGEPVAVAGDSGIEYLADGGTRHEVPSGTGSGAGGGEEPEDGHGGW